MNNISLEEVTEIEDLGFYFDSRLVFTNVFVKKINKAHMILGIIKRNFVHFSRNCLVTLYKSLVDLI